MKRIALFFITLCLSVSAYAAPKFKEGVHYKVVGKIASSKPVVTEYFSFFCAHCYRFERAAEQIKKDLPPGATFEKRHVEDMKLASKESTRRMSLTLGVIEKMKLGEEYIGAVFEHIHKDKKYFTDDEEVRDLFVSKGIDGKKFDNAMKNFSVKASANRMKKGWRALPNEVQQRGVPSIIVNNKYWINASELKSRTDYKDIIDFLLAKKD